ncbi:MAG: zinc-ribbon domain-containing protein [Labilithrix sp.]|nr:zinc-ribbon domain-containing protein [Labilithrix sp.]
MDVTCPACAARYKADEEKLRGKTARMRCKACDTVWLVSGPGAEAMPDSKRAAVVKRGADREHRDLFASRPLDFGSVKQTLHPPPPEGVAARNETSVLFTVDSLKGAARMKTPEPEPAPLSSAYQRVDDDEGIIDLNALASVPPKAGARHVAPLFSEPPPAAFAVDATGSQEIASAQGFTLGKRMIAGIAAAAVAVVLVIVGLAAAFKGEEPTIPAVTASLAAPPPAPVTAAPAPPEPAPAPVASASASSSDDEPATPAKGKKGKKGKGFAAAGKGKAKTETAFVSKPAPKAQDKCGCKGDFSCILRCTAKGK